MIQVLNNSQLTTFRQCPHRWGLRYFKKLVPDRASFDARAWGTLYHLGQDVLWSTKGSPACFAEVANEHTDILLGIPVDEPEERKRAEAAFTEVMWALEFYRAEMQRELLEWTVLATEYKFRVRVAHGVYHEGDIDLIAYDPTHNRVVVVDHKSTGINVDAYEGRLQLDTQHVGYVTAVKSLVARGEFPDIDPATPVVFQWHVIRRKLPSQPRVNKLAKKYAQTPRAAESLARQTETGEPQGFVSTAAIDTLPGIYEDALSRQWSERGLAITDDQREHLKGLANAAQTYFRMTETYVPDRRMARWRTEFLIDAKRIREAYRMPVMQTRNPSACSLPGSPRCEYRDICIEPNATTGYIMDPDIIEPIQKRK